MKNKYYKPNNSLIQSTLAGYYLYLLLGCVIDVRYDKVGNWINVTEKIRYREVGYYEFNGDWAEDMEFEVFKRPYFWGLIGKKKWIWSITTNSMETGLGCSEALL